MLRAEVYARALRASQNVRESAGIGVRAMRLMSGRGVGECGSGRHSHGVNVIYEVGWPRRPVLRLRPKATSGTTALTASERGSNCRSIFWGVWGAPNLLS